MSYQNPRGDRKLWPGVLHYLSILVVGALAAIGEAVAWAHDHRLSSGLATLALAYLLVARVLPELVRRVRELLAPRGSR